MAMGRPDCYVGGKWATGGSGGGEKQTNSGCTLEVEAYKKELKRSITEGKGDFFPSLRTTVSNFKIPTNNSKIIPLKNHSD